MEIDTARIRTLREQMLLRLLFRATHTMNAEMTDRVRACGYPNFTSSFTGLLAHVDTEGTTIAALAERVGTSRQAVSQLVTKIEEVGFLERHANPEDGRSVIVRHTASGRRILLEALGIMSAIESEYSAHLGESEFADLKVLLGQLLEKIDPSGGLLT